MTAMRTPTTGRHTPKRTVARLLPHNLEAEESAIGAMLLGRVAIAAVAEICTSADFYRPAHGHIFDAVTALHGRGIPADPVTVADELGRHGLLDLVGGSSALVTLQAGTPTTANAAHYARVVAEHAQRRRLIAAAEEAVTAAYDLADPDAITGLLRPAIDATRARAPGLTLRRLSDTLRNPPIPKPDLVEGLLRRGELLVMAADASIGKSWMMMDLALKLADGSGAFLGHFRIAGPAVVAYWHGESDPRSTYERWQILLGRDGTFRDNIVDIHDPISLNVIEETVSDGNRRRQRLIADGHAELEQAIVGARADVFVLDTWAAAFDGDENQKRPVAMVLRELQRIAVERNCAIVIVHHFGKDNESVRRDPMHMWRGSTRLGDAAQMRITVAQHYKPAAAKAAGLDEDEARRYADVHFRSRTRRNPKRVSVHLGDDFRWGPWADPEEGKDEVVRDRMRRRDEKAEAEMLMLVECARMSVDKFGGRTWGFGSIRQASTLMKVGHVKVQGLLDEAVGRGVFIESPAERKSSSYSLTEFYREDWDGCSLHWR